MRVALLWKRLVAIAVFALFLSGGIVEQRAYARQEKDVRIAVSSCSFGPFILNREWMPVQTRVENRTARDYELAVVVEIPMGGKRAAKVRYLKNFLLPAKSERTVEQAVFFDFPPEAIVSALQKKYRKVLLNAGLTKEHVHFSGKTIAIDVAVIERSSGRVLDSQQMLGKLNHPATSVTAVSNGKGFEFTTPAFGKTYEFFGRTFVPGEQPDDYPLLSKGEMLGRSIFINQLIPGKADMPSGVQAARISMADLPERWATYEGVDLLVLGSLKERNYPARLSPMQEHALLRWIRSGGKLVISPANDIDAFCNGFWQTLLPVALHQSRTLRQEDVKPFEKAYGGTFSFNEEFPPLIADASAKSNASCMVGHRDAPLLAKRRVGGGEVWFMAVAAETMTEWEGGTELWYTLMQDKPEPLPGDNDVVADNAGKALSAMSGAVIPDKSIMVVLLTVYFVCTAVAIVLFKLMKRTEWAWLVALILAGGVTVISFAIGASTRRSVGFVHGEIGLTEIGPGEGNGSVTSFVGVYSPSKRKTDLVWENPDTLATLHMPQASGDREATAAKISSQTIVMGDRFSFPGTEFAPGELFTARAETLVNYNDGITVDLEVGPDGVTGEVTNKSGRLLQNCILRVNRRMLRVGKLKDGQKRDLAACSVIDTLDTGAGASSEQKLQHDILGAALQIPDYKAMVDDNLSYDWPVCLYAWQKGLHANIRLGDQMKKPREKGWQLIAVPIYQYTVKPEVVLPPGVCGVQMEGQFARQLFGGISAGTGAKTVELPTIRKTAGMQDREPNPPRPTRGRIKLNMPVMNRAWNEMPDWRGSEMMLPLTTVHFKLPEAFHGLKITECRLRGRVSLDSYQMQIVKPTQKKVFRQENAYLTLNKDGDHEIDLTLPRKAFVRRVGPDGRVASVAITFTNPSGKASKAFKSWKLHALGLEIKGEMPVQ